MERPSEAVCILTDMVVRIHSQHELAFYARKHLEQMIQVFPVEHPRIMAHIGTDIGRIHEVECCRGVEACEHFEGIVVFDSTLFEQLFKFRQKTIFGRKDPGSTLTRGTGIGERAGEYAGEPQPAECSYGPGAFDGTEVVRMPVNEPCHIVLLAAVGRAQYLEAQGVEVRDDGSVEVDQLAIQIIDHIDAHGLFGE